MRIGTQLWLLAVLSAIACDDAKSTQAGAVGTADGGEDASSADAGAADAASDQAPARADLDEMLDQGIAEFLGAAKPTGSETIHDVAGVADGSVVYDFDPADGPVCMRGSPFHVSVLDQGSDNLMIFMQGGGACVSVLCSATTEASPRGVPQLGVLDPTDPDNPVGGWNMVYVPYCDGSVFGGNNDYGNESDATGRRLHHGQRNFAAALDRALEHFPHPKKVLLAGSSAGGWGTVYHRALVRTQYPDAELSVLNDSGIGFMVNSQLVVDEWGTQRYRPPSCEPCQMHQHMSEFVKYDLEHDPDIVVGDFSSWEDTVIQRFALTDAAGFRTLLGDETAIPAQAFPDRYKRFIIEGGQHTSLQRGFHTTQIDGVTIADWLRMMVDRDPGWTEMMQ